MDEHFISFKVGRFVEARTFKEGYRGAWFRCKITKIFFRKSEMWLGLKYIDYPDEKIGVVKVVQKLKGGKSQTMVRPCFPPLCGDCEMPDVHTISQMVVILNDAWIVEDLVDWWIDGCYWSGRLSNVLENGKFQVELFPPPDGEGLRYEAFSKDLRPSLDWSAERGWTVPQEENYHPCARILKPNSQVSPVCAVNEMKSTMKRPFSSTASETTQTSEKIDLLSGVIENSGGKDSSQYASRPLNATKADGKVALNCMHRDMVEAAVLDLENLTNKVKWMKSMLESAASPCNPTMPLWEFVEHCGSSKSS